MRNIVLVLVLSGILFSCKKEDDKPNSEVNNSEVTITSFDCSGIKIQGNLTKDQIASNVIVTITYTGGNGKSYLTRSHNSTGVSGLSANLLSGTLANGEGVLNYIISGTPDSAGTANFTITLGGVSCNFNLNVLDVNQVENKDWNQNLLLGKWVLNNTIFYKFMSDYNGLTWDEADDINEAEAQKFTWSLKKSLLNLSFETMTGKNVDKNYIVTLLNSDSLVYKDDSGFENILTKVK
jgi:hypothetical protein